MTYKRASEKAQASLRRITPKKLPSFPDKPSKQEYIENLKLKKYSLDNKLRDMKFKGFNKESQAYRKLALEAQIVQDELTQLRSRRKWPNSFQEDLLDTIKEDVSAGQWKGWIIRTEERIKSRGSTP